MWEEVEHVPHVFPAFNAPAYVPEGDDLDQAVGMMASAKRPIILAGNGCIRRRASRQLREFVAKTGIGVVSTFMAKGCVDMDDETWETVLGINLSGPFYYCRAAGRHMLPRSYGRVINLGSTLSSISIPDRTPYASSKGGILQLTRTLALEWAGSGITANCICPGGAQSLGDSEGPSFPPSDRDPLPRWGKPEEIAYLAVSIAGEDAGYITGQCLVANGGKYLL